MKTLTDEQIEQIANGPLDKASAIKYALREQQELIAEWLEDHRCMSSTYFARQLRENNGG